MKTFLLALVLTSSVVSARVDTDSLARVAANVINEERRRIGVDTLEYEADTFCFATDWADSTHRYFNVEKNKFTREDAHRNCDQRMIGYERFRNQEWKHFGECVAFGKEKLNGSSAEHFAKALLGSKDHYNVLMKPKYKKISIGIFVKDGFFNMVVLTTTEYQ
jgi:hypothetical protein